MKRSLLEALFVLSYAVAIVIIIIAMHPGMWLFFPIFYLTSIVTHELGHAIVGKALGAKVLEICIGRKKSKNQTFQMTFLNFKWSISEIPISGGVHLLFPNPSHYRIKYAATHAGGPFVNMCLMAIGVLLYHFTNPYDWDSFWSPDNLLLGLILSNVFILFITFIPGYYGNGGQFKTDGLNFIEVLVLTNEQVTERCRQGLTYFNNITYIDKSTLARSQDAGTIISRYYEDPNDLKWLNLAVSFLLEREDPRFSELKAHSLARPLTNIEKEHQIDEHITLLLKTNNILKEPYSDRYSQELLVLSNNSITAQGTRGSVLIDLGRIEEGKAMLTQVLEKTKSDMDREFCLVFLSIGEEQLGNLDLADRYAKEALALSPSTMRAQDRLTSHTRARLGLTPAK